MLEHARVQPALAQRRGALVELGQRLLAAAGPSAIERQWHRVALTLARGSSVSFLERGTPRAWIDYGAQFSARFPGDPGLAFLNAVRAESVALQAVRGSLFDISRVPAVVERPATLRSLIDQLVPLTQRPDVAAEASLRLGHVLMRLGRRQEALTAFGRADDRAATPYVRHLARLFAGVTLEAEGRRTDAVNVLRAALDAMPRAQSATFALAPMLEEAGFRNEAADLIAAAVKPPLIDPLQAYWTGDPEELVSANEQLRRALAR